MKKFLLSMFVILSFGAYTDWNNYNNPSNNLLISSSSDKTSYELAINSSFEALNKINSILIKLDKSDKKNYTYSNKTSKNNSVVHKKIRRNHRMNTMMGKYKNGSYKGKITDAYYGNIQVKAIIINGNLSDVKILDYPHNAENSLYINSHALPILIKEAIQNQSAKINAVSGASATSPAFKKSLASALTKAKA